MKDLKLNKYEQEILNSVKNEEWESTNTIKEDRKD